MSFYEQDMNAFVIVHEKFCTTKKYRKASVLVSTFIISSEVMMLS